VEGWLVFSSSGEFRPFLWVEKLCGLGTYKSTSPPRHLVRAVLYSASRLHSKLTPSRLYLGNLILSWSRNSPPYVELEDELPCSQESASGLRPDPVELVNSNSRPTLSICAVATSYYVIVTRCRHRFDVTWIGCKYPGGYLWLLCRNYQAWLLRRLILRDSAVSRVRIRLDLFVSCSKGSVTLSPGAVVWVSPYRARIVYMAVLWLHQSPKTMLHFVLRGILGNLLLCSQWPWPRLFLTAAVLFARYVMWIWSIFWSPAHAPRGLLSFSRVGHLVRSCAVEPACRSRKISFENRFFSH
jgi:hypothetical protein